MRITTGSLQINTCMKPTLRVTLQMKFNSSILILLNIWYTYYLIIKLIASLQIIEIQEVLNPQCHLQTINVMEVN